MSATSIPAETKRLLIIEDDKIDKLVIKRSLGETSPRYHCDDADNLCQAEKLLEQNAYDIILTDMNLPDSQGINTISHLLSHIDDVPIVVLSGDNNDEVALEAIQYGAQDFISKKYSDDASLLSRILRHASERHKLKQGLQKTRDRERFLAHYDQCTALPNRVLFLDCLEQAVTRAKRELRALSLCFIDLDRFKAVNDAFGHAAGDQVLRMVGKRLKAELREGDTVARFGGDEFVLILQDIEHSEELEQLCTKLIRSINKPIPFGQALCHVGCSIGIASFPSHGETPEQLIRYADYAMYQAKNQGRNQSVVFTEQLIESKKRFDNLERALQEAMRDPDAHFELSFQPRVGLNDNQVYAVEALIRWNHPEIGDISPNNFIPLAETLDLIQDIDVWVIEKACEKLSQWKNSHADVTISVNVSGKSFYAETKLISALNEAVKKYRIRARNIEIELTESILLEDTETVFEQLSMLKDIGVTIAIDDFGTGFSSLSYLNRLPINTLKIDGSFICDENSTEREQTVLNAIVGLGRALDLNVVAECVETEAQKLFLEKLDCHEGQGYFWGKPNPDWDPTSVSFSVVDHRHDLNQNTKTAIK